MSFKSPKNKTLYQHSLHFTAQGYQNRSLQSDLVSPHTTSIRVRYAETDQMGIVYYANYLVWMEVARVDFCRAIGFHYKDMELDDGVLLAVAESHCRYVSPARFDEEITITTTVPDVNRRFVSFNYEMTCDGRKGGDGSDAPHLPEPSASSDAIAG